MVENLVKKVDRNPKTIEILIWIGIGNVRVDSTRSNFDRIENKVKEEHNVCSKAKRIDRVDVFDVNSVRT